MLFGFLQRAKNYSDILILLKNYGLLKKMVFFAKLASDVFDVSISPPLIDPYTHVFSSTTLREKLTLNSITEHWYDSTYCTVVSHTYTLREENLADFLGIWQIFLKLRFILKFKKSAIHQVKLHCFKPNIRNLLFARIKLATQRVDFLIPISSEYPFSHYMRNLKEYFFLPRQEWNEEKLSCF